MGLKSNITDHRFPSTRSSDEFLTLVGRWSIGYQHHDEEHWVWEPLAVELDLRELFFLEAGNEDTFQFSLSVGNCHP